MEICEELRYNFDVGREQQIDICRIIEASETKFSGAFVLVLT